MASTYTWQVVSGSLPPGLALNGEVDLDEVLTGTPTTTGTYNFTIRITNDISAAFDDQAFSITITEVEIELTPDLGTNIDDMFNPAVNSKLIVVGASKLIDVTGSVSVPTKYCSIQNITFQANMGFGLKVYQIPDIYTSNVLASGRRYLWRINSAPNVIKTIWLI